MSPSASAAMERLWPRFGIAVDAQPLDLEMIFGAGVPVILELGSGMGETTSQLALAEPGVGILAIDVHSPGIGALLRTCEEQRISNIRTAIGDGISLLNDQVSLGSLAGIRAYFPDPWPKTRHHKRRLIRPDLVRLMASRLAPGGFIHVATDWAPYAEQMLAVLTAEPLLANDFDGYAPRPMGRPQTRYEQIGIANGRAIHDLQFRRVKSQN